ncbi:MAG: hypothetical protein JWL81_1134 [Verrucomicrobiales bacterium]|nr:hypothetical protein [Verrucomicrobiales bacterium]
MSWYYYNDEADQKRSVQQELEKRRRRGETYEAFVSPQGNKLTQNFWGQAWCGHLEKYGGYDKRLARGRSYLRQGNVYNLTIDEGLIAAEVSGSSLYEVEINISPLAAARWKEMKKLCTGQVASLLDLLSGKLGPGLMEIITDPDKGLFPRRKEFTHHCSCPDYADLCKHQSAVLYAVGVLFDRDPKFFFELRGVDPSELIASSATALTISLHDPGSDLAGEDLSALFGIELDAPPAGPSGVVQPCSVVPGSGEPVESTKPAYTKGRAFSVPILGEKPTSKKGANSKSSGRKPVLRSLASPTPTGAKTPMAKAPAAKKPLPKKTLPKKSLPRKKP